jgi:aminoglycoside phosphotransferase (APT) family kinase protein
MEHQLIRKIFEHAGLGTITRIDKIEIGFSNDVYSIDDRYILKVGKSEEDDQYLLRDIYLCNLLADRVPAPRIIYSDVSRTLLDRVFMIYHKIPGNNLYSRWHLLEVDQRRELTRQICSFLRRINETPYEGFAREFGIDIEQSWHDRMKGWIDGRLDKVTELGLLPAETLARTRTFLDENLAVLRQEKMALTYHDPHFDNIIVSDDDTRIAGVLDFERTDILSIDFVLDLVRRMVNQPGKYASEESEPFTRMEHYSELMEWYEEFYPEGFAFEDLDKRLDIYTIEHSLAEIFYYPEVPAAREELLTCIG